MGDSSIRQYIDNYYDYNFLKVYTSKPLDISAINTFDVSEEHIDDEEATIEQQTQDMVVSNRTPEEVDNLPIEPHQPIPRFTDEWDVPYAKGESTTVDTTKEKNVVRGDLNVLFPIDIENSILHIP